ncbi:MAG: SRPBCC domain-containing protein [candidate division WOR-3 bacterium]|nr:SRPBCC domain-containing protein [candidate division WOR-3 bacterium]
MDKILYHSVQLQRDAANAFKMFTRNEHLQSWLTEIADVEPTVGEKFELFWNPKDKENDSTIGCKITAIELGRFPAFEWKAPNNTNTS